MKTWESAASWAWVMRQNDARQGILCSLKLMNVASQSAMEECVCVIKTHSSIYLQLLPVAAEGLHGRGHSGVENEVSQRLKLLLCTCEHLAQTCILLNGRRLMCKLVPMVWTDMLNTLLGGPTVIGAAPPHSWRCSFIVFTLWFSSFYLSVCQQSSHVYLLAFQLPCF